VDVVLHQCELLIILLDLDHIHMHLHLLSQFREDLCACQILKEINDDERDPKLENDVSAELLLIQTCDIL
jgi:hypothetical protein